MYTAKTKHYQIWCENNVLIAVIRGQWDAIEAEAYVQDFQAVARKLINEPWAHITYLDDWRLSTPDASGPIQELERWCMNNNLHCDAVVYAEHAIKDYVLENALQNTSRNPDVYRHFTSSKEAIDWITRKGFLPTSERIVG
ncbi:hypothetical protein QTP81_15635 [Alteromonas sp. ASW11-36]|uniref:STAS/SEC14 domain-containing protein n=1 Tax=Alteromonas arenosi TaxID=3055817 RepID=A0ABT7T0X3_9ALTE|nr:hypothetical protein [Alteromonas sp. ASW11-36]MDM7862035.1 hypothetical protein [Alteromonas sp. ASW11-36]